MIDPALVEALRDFYARMLAIHVQVIDAQVRRGIDGPDMDLRQIIDLFHGLGCDVDVAFVRPGRDEWAMAR